MRLEGVYQVYQESVLGGYYSVSCYPSLDTTYIIQNLTSLQQRSLVIDNIQLKHMGEIPEKNTF